LKFSEYDFCEAACMSSISIISDLGIKIKSGLIAPHTSILNGTDKGLKQKISINALNDKLNLRLCLHCIEFFFLIVKTRKFPPPYFN
jgi:hypothetical protein